MIENIKRVLIEDDGTALVEYALAAAITTAVMCAGVNLITSGLSVSVNDLSSALNANEVAGY
jgi:Flp pilus assembly pilin Flp